MTGEHDDRDVRIGVGAGLADHLHQLEAVEDRHCPIGNDDVGNVVRKGFKAGRAILSLIDFAGAEPMQQGAQYAAHMCVVVDDEETQTVEIDANHGAPASGALGARYHRMKLPGRR